MPAPQEFYDSSLVRHRKGSQLSGLVELRICDPKGAQSVNTQSPITNHQSPIT
ncbi:MAG: hypothetical protein ACKO9I_24165 [Sphaerospermopsis kisseleviana]|uniref:Uncharacterized protein n=1 Tax=Sphaerospermopsis aphanizomenoides LEGE 00250 TaxID=2777972 RepID=A0ABR9VA09_9CYAN|nr:MULTISPECIES: hypothetical protein [Sphaerospermopsis]MBE9235336.1 hypothetical protein [Sphaerospermopsis aphanizomenoides LEGE 00250]